MLRRSLTVSAMAAATLLAVQMPSFAASIGSDSERVIVIDAPDVQKLNTGSVPGFRTSEVIGTDVYGNAGKRIGEVEDFIMSGNGYFYAIIDIDDGPLEDLVDLSDDDLVVVPWDQLRVSTREQQAAQ